MNYLMVHELGPLSAWPSQRCPTHILHSTEAGAEVLCGASLTCIMIWDLDLDLVTCAECLGVVADWERDGMSSPSSSGT